MCEGRLSRLSSWGRGRSSKPVGSKLYSPPSAPSSLSPFRSSEHTIHGAVYLLNRYRVLTMKYNLRAKDLVQSDTANHDNNSSPPTQCSLNINEKVLVSMSPAKSYSQEQTTSSSVENVMSDNSTGLTQQISELTINDDISRFLISVGTNLFFIPTEKITFIKSPSWSTTWWSPRWGTCIGVQTTMNGCARN